MNFNHQVEHLLPSSLHKGHLFEGLTDFLLLSINYSITHNQQHEHHDYLTIPITLLHLLGRYLPWTNLLSVKTVSDLVSDVGLHCNKTLPRYFCFAVYF